MNEDFLDLLRNFENGDVRFLIVGAYAIAVHGHPRATGDLDVWLEPDPLNAKRAYEALQNFGAPLSAVTVDDLKDPDTVFQMGVPPRRIDLLTSISGIEFDEAWEARTSTQFGDLEVPVIGLDELIRNKRATGRKKDEVDAETLEQIRDTDRHDEREE